MAGLKELRTRIATIKSTQKITSAMKMVAASSLRKSQGLIAKSEFYNHNILASANRLLFEFKQEEAAGKEIAYPRLMIGTGKQQKYLLIVFTSDRGLCGSYNATVAREAMRRIEELKAENKEIMIYCVGRKGRDILKRKYADLIVGTKEGVSSKGAKYYEASDIGYYILDAYSKGDVDVCEVVVSRFKSAINRTVVTSQLLPVNVAEYEYSKLHVPTNVVRGAFYDYEPDKMELLEGLLPLIFRGSIFQSIVHSQASEHGARMTSMDNATRNASDIINRLTIKYNLIRQTAITTELIEIISGAEAL